VRAQESGFELLAVSAIIDPFARGCDPLAGCDGRSVSHQGNEIAMPAGLGPQHTEAILGIVIRNALDKTGVFT